MNQQYIAMEQAREQAFESIWDEDINAVFADVAKYYDRANVFATLGLLNYLRDRFLATIDVQPAQRVLDVCAGTNVIGIGLMRREPTLDVCAVDRSAAMQEVGRIRRDVTVSRSKARSAMCTPCLIRTIISTL